MKNLLNILILTIFVMFNKNFVANALSNPPTASADSVVLMDAATGAVLYSKNPNDAYPPASTTKIMTALLTLENSKLTDQVTVGKNPTLQDGSAVGITEGEIFTVKDLLYGLLLESGNDCAMALAEHIGGSREKFVEMMNKRAKELGCTNTNFVNPSGLYDGNHKISSKDLALIMKELTKHPEYKTIAMSPFYKIPPTNKSPEERYVNNKNRLVLKRYSTYYQNCIGGKTGYTIQSKHSYVAAAERDGQTLIVSLVHDGEKTYFEDSKNLFEFGFNNFELKKLFSKGEKVSSYDLDEKNSIPLLASKDFYYVQEKGNAKTPTISIAAPNIKNGFIKEGQTISEASISLNNSSVGKLDLYSGIDYDSNPISSKLIATTAATVPTKLIVPSVVALFIISLLTIRRLRLVKRDDMP